MPCRASVRVHRILGKALLTTFLGDAARPPHSSTRVLFSRFLNLAAVRGRNGKTKATAALFRNCGVRSAKQGSKCGQFGEASRSRTVGKTPVMTATEDPLAGSAEHCRLLICHFLQRFTPLNKLC
jgi:hypothetical protein